ncbi:MAG: tripartite tricarboxylate transporter TctB family protein [Pseudaminobacter sp.]|nr:tripartite tricarboxylate transporter TctB family protein [Pseudaminobacter sp.]
MDARISLKDMLSGLIFIGFGVAFGYAALNYEIGTALRMGPAYFPLILAGIIILLGSIIVIQSFAGADATPLDRAPWLGLVLIVGALIFFGVTVRGLGLAPALFVTTFLSAFASRRTGPLAALVLAAGLTLLCTAIFIWALGLPLRVVGPWLGF